ncbi:MAG: hypothetical protein HS120_02500 [Burkholderiales bacterium]|nr:hypothetical protein [Burkholderiales bacterium]
MRVMPERMAHKPKSQAWHCGTHYVWNSCMANPMFGATNHWWDSGTACLAWQINALVQESGIPSTIWRGI